MDIYTAAFLTIITVYEISLYGVKKIGENIAGELPSGIRFNKSQFLQALWSLTGFVIEIVQLFIISELFKYTDLSFENQGVMTVTELVPATKLILTALTLAFAKGAINKLFERKTIE